ncbi:MAG: glucose 1-dehydrogenase [Proteobacteria bacterium]|jgi:3-oxoacyl-[acyl-carrier protein] reductase|nr:glucose 1-dehydrogenase [Pseudomonadota bacterium]
MLENKTAIITGSSRGIGAASAKLLAANGAGVAVNFNQDRAAGEQVVKEIEASGGRAILVQADVTDREQVEAMVAQTSKELGQVDILVNNANMSFPITPFTDFSWDDFARKLDNEMRAAFFCCQAVVPEMIKKQGGVIINVSSGLSRRPGPGFVAHSSAKGALDAFTRALALELGPHNIRVNTVAPGLTITDATRHQPSEVHEMIRQHTPLRRLGQPEDMAGAVLFYCVDWSRFITGTYLPVCGGTNML